MCHSFFVLHLYCKSIIQQFFKNVGEVWASSPHLRSKLYLQQVFPAAIASFETVQFKQS